MHVLESALPKNAYLNALKGCLTSPFAVFSARMCGIVMGSFFSVAYYSPREWNRRITGECNRAWGWVKEVDGKTEVHFIRGKGLFSPFWLIFLTLLLAVMEIFMVFSEVGGAFDLSGEMGMVWLFATGISVVTCGISAFHSSITEQGIEGAGEITRMLRDPSEYYC